MEPDEDWEGSTVGEGAGEIEIEFYGKRAYGLVGQGLRSRHFAGDEAQGRWLDFGSMVSCRSQGNIICIDNFRSLIAFYVSLLACGGDPFPFGIDHQGLLT